MTSHAQPANNTFGNAWTLTGTLASTNGNNTGATRESGEPFILGNQSLGGASVWFNWTAPVSGGARIDTAGSSFNTILGVYSGLAVNALSLVASNDNGTAAGEMPSTDSYVECTATTAGTYLIVVSSTANSAAATSAARGERSSRCAANHISRRRQVVLYWRMILSENRFPLFGIMRPSRARRRGRGGACARGRSA